MLDIIWEGDKLKRKEEARLLERFLNHEVAALATMKRDQAFVLALDAQYGEGKTWFLSRLRQQLALNHPVAFVDAWVDDASNEPLVSIMAALQDALEEFTTSSTIKETLGAVTRAAFPIVGKAVIGAGGKVLSKFLGDQFGDDAKEALASAAKKSVDDKDNKDDPLDSGIDKMVDGVNQVVDAAGKAMLDAYHARRASRVEFKNNLRRLAKSINTSSDPRLPPIYVFIDELDRCRPNYAISLLEEIKHIFDVSGIVFIIALHQRQLEHSVKAVYGNGFEANNYLRRFFNRHYSMRKLSVAELVVSHFAAVPCETKFSYPDLIQGVLHDHPSPAWLAGMLLNEWEATPRETLAIIDALRIFVANWEYDSIPIELPLALKHIFLRLRNMEDVNYTLSKVPIIKFYFPNSPESQGGKNIAGVDFNRMDEYYRRSEQANLLEVSRVSRVDGPTEYISDFANLEIRIRFDGEDIKDPPRVMTTWSEYAERARQVGRFADR